MSDRDLLEAAAMAAGQERSAAGDLWSNARGALWDPLTDDGDNARLRRTLRIVVQWFSTEVAAMHWDDQGRGRSWAEEYGDEPAAAERRAVVRAAAALTQPEGGA